MKSYSTTQQSIHRLLIEGGVVDEEANDLAPLRRYQRGFELAGREGVANERGGGGDVVGDDEGRGPDSLIVEGEGGVKWEREERGSDEREREGIPHTPREGGCIRSSCTPWPCLGGSFHGYS